MPNFFWSVNFLHYLHILPIFWGGFLLYFCLLIVIFFKVSVSESLQGQNPPISKRKRAALNRPVRKRIKTKKLEEALLVGLMSDDEDAEFVGGPIIKKSKKKKKG